MSPQTPASWSTHNKLILIQTLERNVKQQREDFKQDFQKLPLLTEMDSSYLKKGWRKFSKKVLRIWIKEKGRDVMSKVYFEYQNWYTLKLYQLILDLYYCCIRDIHQLVLFSEIKHFSVEATHIKFCRKLENAGVHPLLFHTLFSVILDNNKSDWFKANHHIQYEM